MNCTKIVYNKIATYGNLTIVSYERINCVGLVCKDVSHGKMNILGFNGVVEEFFTLA